MHIDVRTIATPQGDARLHAARATRPVATLVLGHGAGKGVDSRDLEALADALPRQDISVFRIEQPWAVAGKKVAARPALLDEATTACLNAIRVRTPIVLGGRSAGARVACRLAASHGAVGCVALAFPLHPPGRPESSRLPELLGAGVPTLVVQGERDTFGGPAEFPASVEITPVPDADHGFKVPKRAELSQEETLALIVEAVVEWVTVRVG
jgi:predicted alpha/beta-hydrolase family hydrolase